MINFVHRDLDKKDPSASNQKNMINFVHFLYWIMEVFQYIFNCSKVPMLDAPVPSLDSFSNMVPRFIVLPESHNLLVPNSFQSMIFQDRSFSLLSWPIGLVSFDCSSTILSHIGDKIISEIATSIIFGIAREEGILDEECISLIIDNLLREFQFWNRLVLGHTFVNKSNFLQGPQFNNSIEGDVLTLEESMGLESIIYQYVQKSADLIPQGSYCQHDQIQITQDCVSISGSQNTFNLHPLSILQTQSKVVINPKNPKPRGWPKGSKTRTEIAAGLQTKLDNNFIVSKILTRRTRCSPCPQLKSTHGILEVSMPLTKSTLLNKWLILCKLTLLCFRRPTYLRSILTKLS